MGEFCLYGNMGGFDLQPLVLTAVALMNTRALAALHGPTEVNKCKYRAEEEWEVPPLLRDPPLEPGLQM